MNYLHFRQKMFELACFNINQIYAWQQHFDRNNLTRWIKRGLLVRLKQGYYTFSELKNKPGVSYYFANRIWSWVKSVEMIIFVKKLKMKHYIVVTCVHCGGDDLVKNGHSENYTQRWLCKGCKKSFQLEYSYNARKPGVKEQIIELTMNSSGVRDISRTLQINKNTVISELKKNSIHKPLLARHDRSQKA